jgi:WD40 repeat protein
VIGKRIVTADASGTLIFWDPRSPTPLWKLTPEDGRFHVGGITSLAVNPASTVAVVGGASGDIRVVNLNKGEIVGALAPHQPSESVEAIAFMGAAGTAEVVVTGSTGGEACVWDLNTLKVRNTLEHEVGSGFPSKTFGECLTGEPTGIRYMLGPTPGAQLALGRLSIGRLLPSDVGHSHWRVAQRT